MKRIAIVVALVLAACGPDAPSSDVDAGAADLPQVDLKLVPDHAVDANGCLKCHGDGAPARDAYMDLDLWGGDL